MRVHFKNSVEVASAVRGMPLERAKTYLQHVLDETEAIPFNRFKGGRGRHAQAKNLKVPGSLVGWPKNAVKAIQSLLLNAEANAESKGLDTGEILPQCNAGATAAAVVATKGRAESGGAGDNKERKECDFREEPRRKDGALQASAL